MSLFHGLVTTKKIKVGGGAVYTKRVKFCAVHGEIDLFMCGESEWEILHGKCQLKSESGAGLELPKILKKAA